MDFDLLQIVRKKENFARFKPFIKEHALSKEGLTIFNAIEEYFVAYPTTDEISWDSFESWFVVLKNPKLHKESLETYRGLFEKLRKQPGTAVLDDVLKHFVTCDYATQIANIAIQVAQGDEKASMDSIADLCQQHDKEVGRAVSTSDLFVPDDVSSVLAVVKGPGYEWRLGELNVSCGPLRVGDFVVVGARPETGKTTLLASEVGYMGSQIKGERPVLWVNNEERSSKVKLRVIQAVLGWTVKDIEADLPKALKEYQRIMGMKERVLILDNAAGINSVKQLEPLFKQYNPAIIVFDQLDKVEGFRGKNDKEDIRLGSLYKWARDLSHAYGPVIAASQASDSAEGQQWIYQNQLRGSRTDKAGEADAIITIGKVHDPLKQDTRYIHIAKNKLYGGAKSEEKERHGFWEVKIKPEIARYEGTR